MRSAGKAFAAGNLVSHVFRGPPRPAGGFSLNAAAPRSRGRKRVPHMRTSRLLAALAAPALLAVLTGAAQAGASATIDQIRNGLGTSPTTPTPSWVSGNAGGSNSHYLESHSNAYRAVMDNLPTNGKVIELVIGYDVKRSGSYAIDYLTHFQRLLPHVTFAHTQPEVIDPLAGITGVGPVVTTAPIPVPTQNVLVDPDGADSAPAA